MKKKLTVGSVIVAAGKGTRMGLDTPKQFLELDEKPMVLYSLDAFAPLCDKTVVVTGMEERERMEAVLQEAGLFDNVLVCDGGETRAESSFAGLKTLEKAGGCDIVLIHDAARCMITEDVIRRVIADVERFGTGIAAVKAKDTVKLADESGKVLSTPDRKSCYQIQTPQGFFLSEILAAYEAARRAEAFTVVTDDASVMERFGDRKVRLSEGSEENFKVTTSFDLVLAETVLTVRRLKTGIEA